MGRVRNTPSVESIRSHWNYEFKTEGCFKCWYGYPVERAHIISVCDGGSDELDNLHLLCSSCHKISEFMSEDTYWNWINVATENVIQSISNGNLLRVYPELKEYIYKELPNLKQRENETI